MVRGTTPTFELTFPPTGDEAIDKITELGAKFVQNKRVILAKNLQDFQQDGSRLLLRLTEAETLLFRAGVNAEFQARIVFQSSDVQRTIICPVPVDPIL